MTTPELEGKRYLLPQFVPGAFCYHPEGFLTWLSLKLLLLEELSQTSVGNSSFIIVLLRDDKTRVSLWQPL